MEAAANDLIDLVQQKYGGQSVSVIAGHSLGGKTTLEYLKQAASNSSKTQVPRQVWPINYFLDLQSGRSLNACRCRPLHLRYTVLSCLLAFPIALPVKLVLPIRKGASAELLCQPSDYRTMQVWILDTNIGKVTVDKDAPSDVDNIVKEIRHLHSPIASREWLYKYMEDRGYSTGLRLWMGSNLVPDGQGKLKWGFNIEGASGELAEEPALQHRNHSDMHRSHTLPDLTHVMNGPELQALCLASMA